MLLSFMTSTDSRDKEVADVLATLEKNDMKGSDISDNEFAKSHARYMIGGSPAIPNERVFRFGMCLWS